MIAIVHALQTVRLKVVKLRLLVTWILGNALMGAKLDSGRMTAPVHAQAARIINVIKEPENVLGALMENGEMTALNHVLIARIINVTLRLEYVLHARTGK